MPDEGFFKAKEYIESLGYRGIKLGLENITRLLAALGNPHEEFKVIHVAGTNGKGSTCSMISSILTEVGINNGLYISPHVETFKERIQINGHMIGDGEAEALIWSVAESLTGNEDITPTYFEFMTAMAFSHFANCGVEVAVVEVGLGGRFDSTNVVNADISVITSIDLDHTEHLGMDVSSIAFEKAGIIKPGRPVVISVDNSMARERVLMRAKELNAPFAVIGEDFHCRRGDRGDYYETLDFESGKVKMEKIKIGLCGAMQPGNAATAIQAVKTLQDSGIEVDESAIRAGLLQSPSSARFEIVSHDPLTILDGAHNPAAASALAKTLLERFGPRSVDFVFGAMADKDYRLMLQNLAHVAASFTMFSPNVPRAENPRLLAEAQVDVSIRTCVAKTMDDVVDTIFGSGPDSIWVVTGSFYTLGEARPSLREVMANRLIKSA